MHLPILDISSAQDTQYVVYCILFGSIYAQNMWPETSMFSGFIYGAAYADTSVFS